MSHFPNLPEKITPATLAKFLANPDNLRPYRTDLGKVPVPPRIIKWWERWPKKRNNLYLLPILVRTMESGFSEYAWDAFWMRPWWMPNWGAPLAVGPAWWMYVVVDAELGITLCMDTTHARVRARWLATYGLMPPRACQRARRFLGKYLDSLRELGMPERPEKIRVLNPEEPT